LSAAEVGEQLLRLNRLPQSVAHPLREISVLPPGKPDFSRMVRMLFRDVAIFIM